MTEHDLSFAVGGQTEDLAGRVVDEHGCRVTALSEGTAWGTPESLKVTLTSMLRDGDLVAGVGYGNRLPSVNLMIEGPDLAAIAATEQRLQRLTARPGLLRWQPDDPFAAVCVFEVVWSQLVHQFDDLEGKRSRRGLVWGFDALPFARAETASTVSLSTGGLDEFYDGSSTTGWTTDGGATFSIVSGALLVTGATVGEMLTYATTEPLTEGQYIVAELTHGGFQQASVSAGPLPAEPGFRLSFAGVLGVGPEGGQLYAYGPALRSFTPTSMSFEVVKMGRLHALYLADGLSAGRQALLQIVPGGSAPTYGSIHVHDSDLGLVLVHTGPDVGGFTPPLSPWEDPSSVATSSADATSPSGKAWSAVAPVAFAANLPASQVVRTGAAVLRALAKCTTPGTDRGLTWSVTTAVGGTQVPGGFIHADITHRFAASGVYELVDLGILPMPPTRVGANGTIWVQVQSHDADVTFGEWYITPTGPEYATTIINAGTASDLWIDAPSIDDPAGSVWIGEGGDRADAYGAGPLAQADEVHGLHPEGTRIFVLSGSTSAAVDVEWHERYHDHVTKADPVEVVE